MCEGCPGSFGLTSAATGTFSYTPGADKYTITETDGGLDMIGGEKWRRECPPSPGDPLGSLRGLVVAEPAPLVHGTAVRGALPDFAGTIDIDDHAIRLGRPPRVLAGQIWIILDPLPTAPAQRVAGRCTRPSHWATPSTGLLTVSMPLNPRSKPRSAQLRGSR